MPIVPSPPPLHETAAHSDRVDSIERGAPVSHFRMLSRLSRHPSFFLLPLSLMRSLLPEGHSSRKGEREPE